MRSSVLLLSLVALLFPVFASAQSNAVTADGSSDATSTGVSSVNGDPNLVATPAQAGEPDFSWFAGVTTTGAQSANPSGDHLIVFQTLETQVAEVASVDVHYSIDQQPLSNFPMSNSSLSYWTFAITIESPSTVQFNFTYKSVATGTSENTYTYEYNAATNQITQVTVVVIPAPSTLVIGPTQTSDISSLTWYPAIQLYSNIANYYTVEFRSNAASITNDWVDLHYIITDENGYDGLSQSFSMTINNTDAATAGTNFFYHTIEKGLFGEEKLKFNFTYWDGQNAVGQNTIAFLWSPATPNTINYMSSINQNVNVNTNGGAAIVTSTGPAGPSTPVGTTTGTNGNTNTNGTSSNSNTNTNNPSKNPPNAASSQHSASMVLMSCMAIVALAASVL